MSLARLATLSKAEASPLARPLRLLARARALSPLSVRHERNDVPVEIAHMKISPAPRLFGRLLSEGHAALIELLEQRGRVGDLDRGQADGAPRPAFQQ